MFLSDRARNTLSFLEEAKIRGNRSENVSSGWQCVSLAKRLKARSVCRTELDAWEALGELRQQGYLTSISPIDSRTRVPQIVVFSEREQRRLLSLMQKVSPLLGLKKAQIAQWERALDGPLADWSLGDQLSLAEGFRCLAADTPNVYRLTIFQASARYLLGSSKLLGGLKPLARAFEIDLSRFAFPVVRVLVSTPENPEAVLFIENPQSFDQVCRCGVDQRLAVICSFGYGLSLAEALAHPEYIHLIGNDSVAASLPELLRLSRLMYWGDLDPEGFRIYQRLKHSLPNLALSALYIPMIDAMTEGVSHPLNRATGKRGQVGISTARGLDQEYLGDELIGTLAHQKIRDSHWPECLGAAPL